MARHDPGRWRTMLGAMAMVLLARLVGLTPTAPPDVEPALPALPANEDDHRVAAGLIVAACAGLAFLCAWILAIPLLSAPPDLRDHLPVRLALSLLLAVGACRAWSFQVATTRRYWTTWWDPSSKGPDGSIGWADVLRLTRGGAGGDPLTPARRFRRRFFKRRIIPHILATTAALTALYVAVERLIVWRLPAIVWVGAPKPSDLAAALANVSSNLTAYLALLAASVSIVFTYHQLRAKVRADNRQAWIDRARRLIARIIRDADEAIQLNDAAVARRIELELMLNPSEKDHRLLLYLVQRLARVPGRDQIAAGQHLRSVIAAELGATRESDKTLLGVLDEDKPGTLVSYVVRLSHVLLKREWERVKHTR